ncbi:DUF935 domain-containing protein [Pendulispora brunnea]|uniref:DUF935 domain-containing protein n=1 Tax=Pendulispora brunnea TaxID=2905690 RepID=A0ABZ2KIK7_9BACT
MAKRKTRVSGGLPPSVDAAPLAPWPLIDRYPSVLGSQISLQTVSATLRLCQTGYRQQYVDLLGELLEREPHGYAVLSQRILNVAGGRLEIAPAKCAPGSTDERRAQELADEVAADIHAIPDLRQSLAALLWAIYYGVCGAEIAWTRDESRWKPQRLHFVHSRRIAYPDPATWRVHIWDQGLVRGWEQPIDAPTQGIYGLPVDEFPGKFVIHAPQLRGEYPTRDGLGRELIWWFVLKSIGARGAAEYLERFGKPWAIGYASTQPDGKPRAANDDDMRAANAALAALGVGSLAGAVLPNSVQVHLMGPAFSSGRIGMSHEHWLAICNSEISKCVRGQTFTTESTNYGSRSTADVGQSGELRLAAYDADCIAETLRRDLITPMMRLNHPDEVRLCPRIIVHVEDEPDPAQRLELAVKGAQANLPIDADAMADEVGLPLVAKPEGEESKPRRMVPLSAMKPADALVMSEPQLLRVRLPSEQDNDEQERGAPRGEGDGEGTEQGQGGHPRRPDGTWANAVADS